MGGQGSLLLEGSTLHPPPSTWLPLDPMARWPGGCWPRARRPGAVAAGLAGHLARLPCTPEEVAGWCLLLESHLHFTELEVAWDPSWPGCWRRRRARSSDYACSSSGCSSALPAGREELFLELTVCGGGAGQAATAAPSPGR